MKRSILLLLVLSMLLAGCGEEQEKLPVTIVDGTFEFTSSDGFIIKGTIAEGGNSLGKSIILVHQEGTDMGSFKQFERRLLDEGYEVIKYDARGHGQSVSKNGERITYQSFGDAAFSPMVNDFNHVLAVPSYDTVYVVGAALGANVAFRHIADQGEVDKSVFVSLGKEYRGINAQNQAFNFGERSALIIASSGDGRVYGEAQSIANLLPNGEFLASSVSAHGAGILESDKDLVEDVIAYLE